MMTNKPKSASSPVPSVTNYPENQDANWIVGFENDGEKVKVPNNKKLEYALGWRTSEMTTNFDTGDPAFFDNFESNTTNITLPGSPNPGVNYHQITLSPGYVYKLIGFVSILEAPPSRMYRTFCWYNMSENQYFGSHGGFTNGSDSSYSGGGSGGAIAYINPTSTTTIQLKCSYSGRDSDFIEYGTSFNIEIKNAKNL